MRADERTITDRRGREARVWRSNEDSWTIRLGIAGPYQRVCAAAVELDPEAARMLASDLVRAADHAVSAAMAS
jgi:hypothetical protein